MLVVIALQIVEIDVPRMLIRIPDEANLTRKKRKAKGDSFFFSLKTVPKSKRNEDNQRYKYVMATNTFLRASMRCFLMCFVSPFM